MKKLGDRQTKVENNIEKISSQNHQLHNKLMKINKRMKLDEINLRLSEQNKPRIEENLINDQLELNITKKNKNQSEITLENNSLSWELLLKALNFPRDTNDLAGFAALNLARKNNTILQLLQVKHLVFMPLYE